MFNKIIPAVLVLCCLAPRSDVFGQELQFSFEETPLSVALVRFMRQSGVDVVYAQRLIRTESTSCVYRGNSPLEALRCIVREADIRIRQAGDTQFVLVPVLENDDSGEIIYRGTISGYVVDVETGESLNGAHVLIPGLQATAVTNEAGYFAFPGVPLGRYRARISYIGFHSRDTTFDVISAPVSVSLSPTTFEVDGIVVEELASNRADLTVIPGLLSVPMRRLEELPGSFGGSDVFEVLRWMPGIQRAGEATGGLIVRGSGSDQNLYLLDGAPIYHPWHAFSLISTFQTETFKDVKLYRGSFPAEYGGRLSAVLDAELRDGSRANPGMFASINALNARFMIESPIGPKSSFMLSGRRSYIDKLIGKKHPVQDDLGRRDTLRTGYYFYDWSAKVSFRPTTNSRLSVSYYSGRDILDLRLPFDLSLDFSSWLRPADLFFEIDQAWGNTLYSVRYQYLASDRLFLTGTAYSSVYDAREAAFIHPTRSSSVNSDYSVRLNDVGFKVDADIFASLSHQLRTGFVLVDHRFRSGIDALVTYGPNLEETLVEREKVRTIEYAVYVQDHWRPTADLQILAGTRLSYFGSGRYLRLSPRFTFQYSIDPSLLVLRGSLTTQVQYLQKIRDRFSFLYDLVSSRWVPASAEVIPARSVQYSVGAESRPESWIRVTVDAYYRRGRNILLPRDEFQSKNGLLGPGIEVSTLLGQYTPGQERSFGIEVEADLSLSAWKILFAYTGSRSQSRTPDLSDHSYRASRFDVPRSSSLVGRRVWNNWESTLSIIWRSGHPITVPVSRYALRDPVSGEDTFFFNRPQINNGRLPPYFRVDLGGGYQFQWLRARWKVRLHLYNLLNRRNVIGRSFDPAVEDFSWKDRLGLPFLPLFEIQMEL